MGDLGLGFRVVDLEGFEGIQGLGGAGLYEFRGGGLGI